MGEANKIKVTVYKFNPQKDKEPRYIVYEVPYTERMTVLSALNYIYEKLDHSLSYQFSCREGLCHACDMIVNGVAVEACSTIVKGDITVEPPCRLDRWGRGFKVIKDLIADDVTYSERDHIFSSRNQAFESIESLAEERTLNHAVIKYLRSIKGKNLSEGEIARDLEITVEELKKILKELDSKTKFSK